MSMTKWLRNQLYTLGTLLDVSVVFGSSKATDVTIAELRSPRASLSSSSLFKRSRCKDANVRRHLRSFVFCSTEFYNWKHFKTNGKEVRRNKIFLSFISSFFKCITRWALGVCKVVIFVSIIIIRCCKALKRLEMILISGGLLVNIKKKKKENTEGGKTTAPNRWRVSDLF